MGNLSATTCAFLWSTSTNFNRIVERRKKIFNKHTCFCLALQRDMRAKITKEFREKEPNKGALERPKVASLSKATVNFDQLYLGQELSAKILKPKAYGCFVDIGLGQDVLIHISELSTHFVKDILETVSVGDIITVYVKSIDVESRKVWLTALPHRQFVNNRKPMSEVQVEDIVKGNIFRLTDSGAFVDFGCICDGFLPRTEVPPEAMSELVLGNQVETRVIRMEKPTRKIWLSIRQVDPQVRNIIKPPLELVLERPSRTTNETVENSNETGEASLEI